MIFHCGGTWWCLFLFVCFCLNQGRTNAFVCSITLPFSSACRRHCRLSGTLYCNSDKSNKEEDEAYSNNDSFRNNTESTQTPYRTRSRSWTEAYRMLIPYRKARLSVRSLGLRSKSDWDEYVADGKQSHGPYLPNHPEEMYATEWESWEEFLGLPRNYEETRHLVRHVLRLRARFEYEWFVYRWPKRAEGLRIPALPWVVFRDDGWIDDHHFFGTTSDDGGVE